MKHLARAALVLLASVVVSLLDFAIPQEIYSTFYTVIGIFFSIGFSIVIGFDVSNVTNQEFVTKVRRGLAPVTRTFIVYFIVATSLFLVSGPYGCRFVMMGPVRISVGVFIVFSFVYILVYMIYNFIMLQKMKDDIGDHIRGNHSR